MKHLKFFSLSLILTLFSFFSFFQTAVGKVVNSTYYTAIDSNETDGPTFDWIDITLTGNYWPHGDDDSKQVSIGFTFNFYGKNYDKVFINSNGNLTFENGDWKFHNENFPYSDGLSRISPYWDDLVRRETNAGVYYQTLGTAPNRMFVVTWHIEDHIYESDSEITFQAILYEGTNQIKFQYLDTTFGKVYPPFGFGEYPPFDNGASATVGLNKGDGTNALLYSYNEAIITDGLAILFTPNVSQNGKMYGNFTVGSWPVTAVVNSQIPCSDVSGAYTTFTMNWVQNGRYNFVTAYNKDSVVCYDDPSFDPMKPNVNFDTTIATLRGMMNYSTPVIIEVEMSDGGEPGLNKDFVHITVKNMSNVTIFEIDGMVTSGSVYATPLY